MKRINKKVILLAVSLLLILSAAIGGTVAYLIDQTGSITNTFTPVKVTPGINENFDRSVKNDVQITNTGDIPAYIRVKVVVTWKDEHGNVYGAAPVLGTDYTWQIPGTDWGKGSDGFYYYTKPVPAGEKTSILLTDCKPVDGKAPHDAVKGIAEGRSQTEAHHLRGDAAAVFQHAGDQHASAEGHGTGQHLAGCDLLPEHKGRHKDDNDGGCIQQYGRH